MTLKQISRLYYLGYIALNNELLQTIEIDYTLSLQAYVGYFLAFVVGYREF